MFRGKESSNRIELSWLVQDLLNFAVLGSLRLWGWGAGGWGCGVVGGCPHTRAHARACMHAHARTCMRGKHDNSMQMAAPIGFGEIPGIPYNVICSCVCVHVHACACTCVRVHVGGVHLLTTPHPHPPTPLPPSWGDPRNQSKFNSTWTNRDISILFEDLKSVEIFPPMGGCIISWVGGLMGRVRSNHWKFKNCWLNQDNSILFENLWFVETLPLMGGCGCVGDWVDGWVNGWGQVKWLKI